MENKLILKKPIMIDGEEAKEISYDFESLIGENLEEAFKEAIKSGHIISANYELDPVIGAMMFAEASNNAYMDVQRFGLADYSKAASLGREYFFKKLSDEESEKENALILSKPILVKGEEIKEINYDFDNLSGNSIEKVFNEATRSKYVVSSSYELDPIIGARMFAESANMEYIDIKRLSLADYAKAASCARDFFMQGLVGDQEENS
ncbi:hypothetical protein [Clostridium beijerinckii]|uniref:Uncharacterized protein (DUF433 family) n=1 Tax=Clostridium beijerinckii TaxID=1520 RepID=A0AAX0B4E9_CLOBE|nr:hypothetical protein [Clostridium beijerinckii]NRT90094.1 uncharacterized protein (DUF433 family) [Clostridium beijerinckii]NYC69624.1 uncharacterized protein (DUF433 family) [Clostridium beijerinckii]